MPQRLKIEFTGHTGDLLSARLDLPDTPPRAYALFAHCFSCSKDLHASRRVTSRLAELGLAVMSFDFTGLGASEGAFSDTNFSTNVADLLAAANWLGREYQAPALLVGHSLGGTAAIIAASKIESVQAVATIAAPSDAKHVLQTFDAYLEEIEQQGVANVALAGRPFTIKKQFLDDVRDQNVTDIVAGLDKPFLVLHAPLDATVGIDNATALFVAAKHPKSFTSLNDADHLLSRTHDAQYAANVISAWSAPYIGKASDPALFALELKGTDVIVSETGRGKYQNLVQAGRHALLADEPAKVGGDDTGPDPYAFVSAGLGACTSITLRMYAERKDWPLVRVSVAVSHRKDHMRDCEDCEDKAAKVDVFKREIRFEGDLDEVQRTRLLEIADNCPVHKTLEVSSIIETRLN